MNVLQNVRADDGVEVRLHVVKGQVYVLVVLRLDDVLQPDDVLVPGQLLEVPERGWSFVS